MVLEELPSPGAETGLWRQHSNGLNAKSNGHTNGKGPGFPESDKP
jgi:hypothetical protein